MNNMNKESFWDTEIGMMTILAIVLFSFIISMIVVSELSTYYCIEALKDKPAMEIKLICN